MTYDFAKEKRDEDAERARLRELDKEVLIDMYLRHREEAETFGLDMQLNGEQYRQTIAEKDAEIERLRGRCEYLKRYQAEAQALVGAGGGHVQ